MKRIFLQLFLIALVKTTFGSCAGQFVNIYPKSGQVSKNPIFLIDFSERDYLIYDKLECANFYIEYENGKTVKLTLLNKNKAVNTNAQFILTSKRKLKSGQKFSLRFKNLKTRKEFKELIEYRIWTVLDEKDKVKPCFLSDFKTTYYTNFDIPGGGHFIRVKGSFKDENKINKGLKEQSKTELLAEITEQNGNSYFVPIRNSTFELYEGSCGTLFHISRKKINNFRVRVWDYSGNKSKEVKLLSFKT